MKRYNCPKCKSENTFICNNTGHCCDCCYKGNAKEFDKIRVKLPAELTDKQALSICLSYRHDFGLLPETDKESHIWVCKEWYRAIRKELE